MPALKKRLKEDLINLRTTPEQKTLIQQAADLLGMSTAAFILENSLKAARREITRTEEFKLARRDAELFLSALENPKAPHPALVQAFKNYEKVFGK